MQVLEVEYEHRNRVFMANSFSVEGGWNQTPLSDGIPAKFTGLSFESG